MGGRQAGVLSEVEKRLGDILRHAMECDNPDALVGADDRAVVDGYFNIGLVAATLVHNAKAEGLI